MSVLITPSLKTMFTSAVYNHCRRKEKMYMYHMNWSNFHKTFDLQQGICPRFKFQVLNFS